MTELLFLVGAPAPTFALSGLYGETLTLEALRAAGRPLLPDPNYSRGNGAVAPTVPLGAVLGQRAPEVKLQDLGGKTVSLADFRGSTTLVLFWNPGRGFCQQMLPDLKAWEASPPRSPRGWMAERYRPISPGPASSFSCRRWTRPCHQTEHFRG